MNRTLERRLVLQAMVGVDEIYPDKTKISLEDWLEAYSRELIVLTAQECRAIVSHVEIQQVIDKHFLE